MDVLFPNHHSLGVAWFDVYATDPVRKLNALLHLADYTSLLPGAVFFTVPEDGWGHEKWQELIGKSVPYCHCAARRVLWPARGRSRMLVQRVFKVVGLDTRVHPGRRPEYAEQPLVVAPYGGDSWSAYALFGFRSRGGNPIIMQRPFMNRNSPRERLVLNQGAMGYHSASLDSWKPGASSLKEWVDRDLGELTFYYVFKSGDRVRQWLPMFSVTGVEISDAPQSSGWHPRVTCEIDASVSVLPYKPMEKHVCVGDAGPPKS